VRWPIATFSCEAEVGRYQGIADFLASLLLPSPHATADFLAPDILNKCGGAVLALLGTPKEPETRAIFPEPACRTSRLIARDHLAEGPPFFDGPCRPCLLSHLGHRRCPHQLLSICIKVLSLLASWAPFSGPNFRSATTSSNRERIDETPYIFGCRFGGRYCHRIKLAREHSCSGARIRDQASIQDGFGQSSRQEVIIYASEWPSGFRLALHQHEEGHEFVYVIEGEQTFEIDGVGTKIVKAGEVIYTPPNTKHFGRNATDNSQKR